MIHVKEISQDIYQPSITKIGLKITYPNFHKHFPGANEFKQVTKKVSWLKTYIPRWIDIKLVSARQISWYESFFWCISVMMFWHGNIFHITDWPLLMEISWSPVDSLHKWQIIYGLLPMWQIWNKIYNISFNKLSAKWQPFYFSLNTNKT